MQECGIKPPCKSSQQVIKLFLSVYFGALRTTSSIYHVALKKVGISVSAFVFFLQFFPMFRGFEKVEIFEKLARIEFFWSLKRFKYNVIWVISMGYLQPLNLVANDGVTFKPIF